MTAFLRSLADVSRAGYLRYVVAGTAEDEMHSPPRPWQQGRFVLFTTGATDDLPLASMTVKTGAVPDSLADSVATSRPLGRLIRTPNVVTVSSPAEATSMPSRAETAYKELKAWLHLTHDEMLAATGVHKSTAWYWRHTAARSRTQKRLLQTHGLIQALIRRIGQDRTIRWLEAGEPSGMSLLLEGRGSELSSRAASILFDGATLRNRDNTIRRPDSSGEDEAESMEALSTAPPAAPRRRVVSARRHVPS